LSPHCGRCGLAFRHGSLTAPMSTIKQTSNPTAIAPLPYFLIRNATHDVQARAIFSHWSCVSDLKSFFPRRTIPPHRNSRFRCEIRRRRSSASILFEAMAQVQQHGAAVEPISLHAWFKAARRDLMNNVPIFPSPKLSPPR
jgi:hypothetical protein